MINWHGHKYLFRIYFLIILLKFGLVSPADAKPSESDVSMNLRITFENDSSEVGVAAPSVNQAVKENLEKSCRALTEALSVGRGPWGVGIFQNISCYNGNEPVVGVANNESWSLVIKSRDGNVVVELVESFAQMIMRRVSFQFPVKDHPSVYFAELGFADIVAIRLLNVLPFAGYARMSDIDSALEISRRSPVLPFDDHLDPPTSLLAFRFSGPRKYIMPNVKGRIVQKSSRHRQFDGTPGQDVIWGINSELKTELARGGVFFQDERGLDNSSSDCDRVINKYVAWVDARRRETMSERYLRLSKQNYESLEVALKLSTQAYTDDLIVKNRRNLNVSIKGKSGILRDWQYVYDKNIKSSHAGDLLSESYESSSNSLGRIIRLGENDSLRLVEVMPYFGVANMKASLFDQVDDNGEGQSTRSLNMSRGYLLGAQGVIGTRARKFKFDGNFGFDYASNFGSKTVIAHARWFAGVSMAYSTTIKSMARDLNGDILAGIFLNYDQLNINAGSAVSSMAGQTNSWSLKSGLMGLMLGVSW